MAVVSRTATLRLDDTATHATNVMQWVVQAAVQDTPAGSAVTITTTRTTAGVPPNDPTSLTLSLRDDAGTLIKSFALNLTSSSQVSTFHFTNNGDSGGAARAGTVEIALRASCTNAPSYDVETDGSPNTPPATFDSHLDRGWIRGTTSSTQALSNVALGGAKNTPAAYDESLFVRTTLGAVLYVARALTVTVTEATPVLSGATNSATSGNFDRTFSNVVDNRFITSLQTVLTTVAVPNATLTGQPDFTVTNTHDSLSLDPRLTVSVQAQGAAPRADSQNDTLYVISADQLFVWARARNARSENIAGVTFTQRIRNGATVNATDSAQVTGADGWTPASPGADLTAGVVAPAGNRIHEAFPAAPADAVGLGTGTQTLGFASAYTADKALAVHVPDEVGPGEQATIKVEYVRSDGSRLALDAAPTVRVYSLDSAGAQVDALPATTATRIGTAEAWQTTWTPTTAGVYIAEARGAFAGGGLEAAESVKVVPRRIFDPTGLFA